MFKIQFAGRTINGSYLTRLLRLVLHASVDGTRLSYWNHRNRSLVGHVVVPAREDLRVLITGNGEGALAIVIAYYNHLVVGTTRGVNIVDPRHQAPGIVPGRRVARGL